MRVYPFPDKIDSREELKRDLLYHKIPAEDLVDIADRAWDTGSSAALALLERYPGASIYQVIREEQLTLEHKERDNVAGNVRYFSEYYSGQKKIILYDESVRKWAKANSMGESAAEELILSHEFFHHLECTVLGPTSGQYTVPRLRLGPVALGKNGIRALSEIGAHGFSHAWYEARGKLPHRENAAGAKLVNYAVNDTEFHGKSTAKKIFEENKIMRFLSGKGK